MIDLFGGIPDALPLQVEICKECIDWSIAEKRIFLKQSLETRLAGLYAYSSFKESLHFFHRYLDNKLYSDSLALIATLNKELKRLDDKNVLMEVQLLESKVYHALRNLAKSRVNI